MYLWNWAGHYNVLVEFRRLLLEYFQGVRYGRYGDEPDESSAAREARVRLDRMNTSVKAAFLVTAVGLPRVIHLPAPMLGGYVCNLSILDNLFQLHQHSVTPDVVLGYVDRAIGDLEGRRWASVLHTLNPLNWLYSLLEALFHIPFRLLKVAGLDGDSVESSWIGKVLKLVLMVVGLVEGLKQAGVWSQMLQFVGATPPP